MIDRAALLASARLAFWTARDDGLPGDMAAVSLVAAIEPLIRADEREACAKLIDERAEAWSPGFCRDRLQSVADELRGTAPEPKWPKTEAIDKSNAALKAARIRDWGLDQDEDGRAPRPFRRACTE